MAEIYNYENDSLVSVTNANDTINNYGSQVTINGGAGKLASSF